MYYVVYRKKRKRKNAFFDKQVLAKLMFNQKYVPLNSVFLKQMSLYFIECRLPKSNTIYIHRGVFRKIYLYGPVFKGSH